VEDVLIAAYCRVVARAPGLTAAERWSRMRQFASVLEQQIAADRLSLGTLSSPMYRCHPTLVQRELDESCDSRQ
jgi:hypothetical protein